MSEELMPCPVCGKPCVIRADDAATVVCSSWRCGYRLSRGDHNTLARRARIGLLIEELSGANVGVSIPPNKGSAEILAMLEATHEEEWRQ